MMTGRLIPNESRQKCSPRTIGEFWANKAKTEWSWNSLRWLSTATTPVLKTDLMLHQMIQKEWHNDPPKPNPTAEKTPPPTLDLSHLPTAPWTRLLTFTNLAPLSRSAPPNLTSVSTLPPSLPSVPAHAEVSLLVAALAAAGAHTITTAAGTYPLVIGANFQLSFHVHPALGVVVGEFQLHPVFQRVSKIPYPDVSLLGMMHAILHSRGDVRDPKTLPQNRHWELHDLPYEEWQTDTPFHPLSPSVSYGELRRLAHPDWHATAHKPETCPHLTRRNDEYGLHWLLYAPLPGVAPAVFPVALSLRSGMDDVFGALALAGGRGRGFWLSPRGGNILGTWAETEGRKVVYVPPGEHSVFPGHVTQRDLEVVGAVCAGRAGMGELAVGGEMRRALGGVEKDGEGMVVFGDVLEWGRGVVGGGWGAFKAWFDGLEGGRGRYFRGLAGVQAKMVGKWLDREVGGVEGGLGRRCELLFGGLMVLGAVPRGEEGGGGTDWGVEGVVGRFAGALSAMEGVSEGFECLLEGVGDGDEEAEMCMAMLRRHKHRRRLESLVGRPDSSLLDSGRPKLEHIRRQLGIAKGIVGRARSIREESDFFRAASSCDQRDNSDSASMETGTREQAVTDMLIWKAILMGMLFWTAPDNSAVLTSGIWESVVPIL